MTDNVTQPQLRFCGFTDAWTQRQLGEVLTTLPFKTLLKEPQSEGEYEVIQQGSVPIAGYANGEPCDEYKNVVIFGDHTLSLYRPQHPFFVATDGVRILKGKKNMDADYLNALLQIHLPANEGYKRYYSIVANVNCAITDNLPEQRRIGEFFAALDRLVACRQRQVDLLGEQKKAYLQRLFPKPGETVPRLRFPGFSGEWEERVFGEFARRESSVSMSSSNAPSVEYEDVIPEAGTLNKDIHLKLTKKTGIEFTDKQILYGKLRPYLHNWLNPDFNGVAVGDWWVLTPCQIDKNFLYQLIQTELFDSTANQTSGSKMPRADWHVVSETSFMVPSNLPEQRAIGSFFAAFDHLIALRQRELDETKQLKKAYLQRMFV